MKLRPKINIDYIIDFSAKGRLNTAYIQYDEIQDKVYLLYNGLVYEQEIDSDVIDTARGLLEWYVSENIEIKRILTL